MGSLGVGTITNSGHQSGVSTQWACHATHFLGSSRGGLGISDYSGPSSPSGSPAPDRNLLRSGSRTGGFPRSSPTAWDQSIVSSELPDKELSSHSMGWVRSTVSVVPLESSDGKGSRSSSVGYILSTDLGIIPRMWSMLVSLKVTHHLGHARLDEAAHLWSLPSGRMACLMLLLHHPLLLECLWLLGHQQLGDHLQLHC